MIGVVVAAIVVFVVIGVVMSRQTRQRKKVAIDDLEREREAVGSTDIFAIVTAEVQDLGLRSIAGAENVQPEVLLRVWKDSSDIVDRCADRADLRYVLAANVAAQDAGNSDVTLVCDGEATPLASEEVEPTE